MEQLGNKNDPTRLPRHIFVPSNKLCKFGSSAAFVHSEEAKFKKKKRLFSLTGSQNRVFLRSKRRVMAASQRPVMGWFQRTASESHRCARLCLCSATVYLCWRRQGPGGQMCRRASGKSPRDILHVHPDIIDVLFCMLEICRVTKKENALDSHQKKPKTKHTPAPREW